MKYRGFFKLGAVLGAVFVGASNFLSAASASSAEKTGLTFVYLHGVGGVKSNPAFCRNLREYLSQVGESAEVVNYEWDSVFINPLKAGASWLKAQRRADEEATAFNRYIDELEHKGSPFILVGFSLGTRVILRALEQCDYRLEHLAGVYFLGSAMTKDTTMTERTALPERFKIINYHSRLRDTVHQTAFKLMNEIPAGGQVGFEDQTVFANYPVACTHAHKGIGLHMDYSSLAEAIAAIELYRQGVRIPGDTQFNLKTRVGKGNLWWNKILTVHPTGAGESVEVEIEQHNLRSGYFRALRVSANGKRTRIARAANLHAILEELGIDL